MDSYANGQVERVMSTLESMFTAAETNGNSWQATINEIQLAINCITNRVTKASPLELLIGKVARPFGLMVDRDDEEIDISDARQNAINNRIEYYFICIARGMDTKSQ